MASVLNTKESREFCDDAYTQLGEIRDRIVRLKERSGAGHPLPDIDGGTFARHLTELAEMIEWKLQILSHSCSYDWKGASEYEGDVQVDERDRAIDSDSFSGGYIGG